VTQLSGPQAFLSTSFFVELYTEYSQDKCIVNLVCMLWNVPAPKVLSHMNRYRGQG
jgi:hypothetical protein